MKNVKVSELKAKLSAFLAEVRDGGEVTVYDRNTPVARIVPLEEADDLVIVASTAAPADLKRIKGVRPRKRIDADRLLRETRGER